MNVIVGWAAGSATRSGVAETELRERLLTGRWLRDLQTEIRKQLGPAREEIVGPADISRNAFLRVWSRLAVCYSPTPRVTGIDPGLFAEIGDYGNGTEDVMPSTLARILAVGQRYWLGCNEVGIATVWSGDAATGKLGFQIVRPSTLDGLQDPERPGVPIVLARKLTRRVGSQCEEVWDVWDLRVPSYQILRGFEIEDDGTICGEDVTKATIGQESQRGDSYWWRWTQGRRRGEPFIPIEIYHRTPPIDLFDRESGSELAQGALTVGVLWSYWLHACRDAGWPQRWIEGLEVVGAAVASGDGATAATPAAIPTDPASVIQFQRIDPQFAGQIGQWGPGSDPEVLGRAILAYEQSLEYQLLPVDYSSTGGDPLGKLQEAREDYIAGLYPVCREHDGHVLEMAAAVVNLARGTDYPEEGYGIAYRSEIEKPEPADDGEE